MTEALGRTQILRDAMDPVRAAALHATLGLDGPPPGHLAILPPFFHQAYFWDPRPPAELGCDGHPRLGAFLPDLGLPRRMWAGGELAFFGPLRAGIPAERTTTIEGITRKQGRTGPLAFVTLRHDIVQAGVLRVSERQDIVYREDPRPDAPRPAPPPAPETAEDETEAHFPPTLLFRYSALTFEGHRIHYDRDYATGTEGYGGLVVHGPLLAQLLMLKATERSPLRRFAFRARSALIDHETATLCRTGDRLWVRGPDGRLCMSAEVEHGQDRF
ncbi:acyl dehydratase [Rhodovulum tesquicola]|uniref:FAS1-like dehydratase domain-containing protein n=1 Tax=Rhodovulum tesquicola TaxID=540254 RepID=UPI002097DE1F|nr:MaoC family dehydratase N-terminal domain-containing protein [Rhodovulum tesquicola]MCO8144660.1 acyl dehydratase [Rhodovulum tesquicola]